MRKIFLLFIGLSSYYASVSQSRLTDEMKNKEEQLRASTKQINQFFRRFNGEENEDGKRYFEADRRYRDPSLRKKYMPVIFDTQTSQISSSVTKDFVKSVTDKKSP